MARDYRNMPWMRETMYTNDVDPSHGPQVKPRERSLEETEALMRGEREEREPRMPPPGLSDGRPTIVVDREPLNYRAAFSVGNEVDIDEHDYMAAPEEYVPKTYPQPMPLPQAPRAHPLGFDQPTHNAPSAPHERAGTQPQPNPPNTMTLEHRELPPVEPNVNYDSLKTAFRLLALKGIAARPGQDAVVQVADLYNVHNLTPHEVESLAHEMIGWAKAARLVKV